MIPGFLKERAADDLARYGHLRLRELKTVVIDFETTGLYPNQGDEIIEMGGVYIDGLEIRREHEFSRLVNPGRPVSPDAFRVHGIPDSVLAVERPLIEVLPPFMTFIDDRVVVGQNIAFDLSFLSRGLEKCQMPALWNPILDTRWLSRLLFPSMRHHSLDAIAGRLELERPSDRHRALGDVLLTAEILVRLFALCEEQGIHEVGEIWRRHQALEGGRHDDVGVRTTLEESFQARKRVQITYGPAQGDPGRPEVRAVDIYYISAPYFLGYCYNRRSIRTFRFDRVARVQSLGDPYQIPENFDPRDHFLRWNRQSNKQSSKPSPGRS